MKKVAIIEARMTSSRLPGKVLKVVNEKPILTYLLNRLKTIKLIDEIVIATTTNPEDDLLEQFSNNENVSCFRGSEEDVMGRVVKAGISSKAELIIEVTGDCPIIDPSIVEQLIKIYLCNDAEYVGNSHIHTYPEGMQAQIFSLNTLIKSSNMTNKPLDREHVTLHIRNNPKLFKPLHLVAPRELHRPDLGLALDEIDDLKLLTKVISHFNFINENFSCLEVINLLNNKPDWVAINKNVYRKGDE